MSGELLDCHSARWPKTNLLEESINPVRDMISQLKDKTIGGELLPEIVFKREMKNHIILVSVISTHPHRTELQLQLENFQMANSKVQIIKKVYFY